MVAVSLAGQLRTIGDLMICSENTTHPIRIAAVSALAGSKGLVIAGFAVTYILAGKTCSLTLHYGVTLCTPRASKPTPVSALDDTQTSSAYDHTLMTGRETVTDGPARSPQRYQHRHLRRLRDCLVNGVSGGFH
jgi:hypothetical protein